MIGIAIFATTMNALQVMALMTGKWMHTAHNNHNTCFLLCASSVLLAAIEHLRMPPILGQLAFLWQIPFLPLEAIGASVILCIIPKLYLMFHSFAAAPECVFPDRSNIVELFKMAGILYIIPISLLIGCAVAVMHKVITGPTSLIGAIALSEKVLSLFVLCSYWLWIVLLK